MSLLRIKVFSGSIFNEVLFSLWLIQLRFFLVFRNAAFGEFNHHSLKRIPFQKKNCYWSFMHASTLRKKVFSRVSVKFISLHGSNNSDSVPFESGAFGDIQDHSLKEIPFQKKNCRSSFRYVSTFPEKVFWGAPVKFSSGFGSSNSDSVVFRSADFGEIKDYSLKKTPFQKQNYFEVLGMYAAYIKTYFQEYQQSAFVFMAQITQVLLFSRMPLLERSKIMVWEQDLFQKKFPMEVLGICLS